MFRYLRIKTYLQLSLAALLFFSVSYLTVHAAGPYNSSDYIVMLKDYPVTTHYTKNDYTASILQNLTASTKDIQLGDEVSSENLETLIDAYCTSVLNAGQLFDGDLLYSARQSAFVYLLCSNIDPNLVVLFAADPASQSFPAFFTGYFAESDFDRLNLPVKKDEKQLAYLYVDDLFNSIINEYFNIKQANVYGLVTNDSTNMKWEDQVNAFSRLYFNGTELCNSKDKLYAKSTCKYMTQYLKSTQKMFQNLNILDPKGMFADYKKYAEFNKDKKPNAVSNFCSSASVLQGNYQILLCGLRGDASEKRMNPFINLVYNELFYYNLFVQYLSNRLSTDPANLKSFSKNSAPATVGTISSESIKQAMMMQKEYAWSYDALLISLRMLRNAYVTYPIHIGFLMYRERLQEFGKSIAKIATPVYTLYDTLRNVQCLRE